MLTRTFVLVEYEFKTLAGKNEGKGNSCAAAENSQFTFPAKLTARRNVFYKATHQSQPLSAFNPRRTQVHKKKRKAKRTKDRNKVFRNVSQYSVSLSKKVVTPCLLYWYTPLDLQSLDAFVTFGTTRVVGGGADCITLPLGNPFANRNLYSRCRPSGSSRMATVKACVTPVRKIYVSKNELHRAPNVSFIIAGSDGNPANILV